MTFYDDVAVIILAAGKGTRMKSDMAKVLHPVAGKSMVAHVVEAALALSPENVHVVVGHQAQRVRQELALYTTVKFSLQKELLGTGDAVKAAFSDLADGIKNVLVLCGDVPLILKSTLRSLLDGHLDHQAKVTVLATEVENPTGYGRIILDGDGNMIGIREEVDASAAEKKITQVNTGIYCFNKEMLEKALKEIRADNNQAEYYLTDVVEIAQEKNQRIEVVTTPDDRQVVGVNTLEDLEKAEFLIGLIGN